MKKTTSFASIVCMAVLTLVSTTHAVPVDLPTVANADFETDAGLFINFPGYVSPITAGNPTEITGWTGSGSRGINPGSGAGAPFRNNGNNLTNVAFIQDTGNIAQTITGWELGKEFRIAFDYNERANGGSVTMTATIGSGSFVDNSVSPVNNAGTTSNAYYAGNILVTPTNISHTLNISSVSNGGDQTLLLDNFRVFRNGPTIVDNGFEDAVQPGPGGFDLFEQANGTGNGTLAGSAWTFADGAGITRNVSAFQNGIPAAEGEQHAMIQNTGSMEQTINGFLAGADYELSLLAMARQGQQFGNDLEVVLDAGLATELILLDISEITASAFTDMTSAAFTATKDIYTLTLRASLGTGAGNDRTTFVDNIWFNQLTEQVVPEPASASLVLLAGGLLCRRRRSLQTA